MSCMRDGGRQCGRHVAMLLIDVGGGVDAKV